LDHQRLRKAITIRIKHYKAWTIAHRNSFKKLYVIQRGNNGSRCAVITFCNYGMARCSRICQTNKHLRLCLTHLFRRTKRSLPRMSYDTRANFMQISLTSTVQHNFRRFCHVIHAKFSFHWHYQRASLILHSWTTLKKIKVQNIFYILHFMYNLFVKRMGWDFHA